MPLPNRPLTVEEINSMISAPPIDLRSFWELMMRPVPKRVYYDGRGKPWIAPKNTILICEPPERSPSACVWIIPGTMS